MRSIFLFCGLVFVAGCGEKVQRKSQSPPFWTTEMFENKAANEVLNLKYTQASLSCRLWTQAATKINLSLSANDVVSLDLLKNTAPNAHLSLKGSLKNHEVTATVTLHKLRIAKAMELTHAETGTRYFAPYSPVLTLQAQINSISASGKLVSRALITSRRDLVENSSDMTAYSVHTPSTSDKAPPFHDYVECSFATTLKPDLKETLPSNLEPF